MVEKLNAYVGSINDREYLVAEKPVNELRQKLMRVGLHFDDVQFTGEEDEVSLPLVMNGGKFGKADDSAIDEFMNEQDSGRKINFVYSKTENGTHRVMKNRLMFEKITNDNVLLFALKHYDNPQCDGEKEFYDDMKRFKYIKRLLKKYKSDGIVKERLLLNHIIVLNNVFGADAEFYFVTI